MFSCECAWRISRHRTVVLPIDALKKDVTGKVVHRDGRGCVRDEHVPLPAHRRLQIQAPRT